MNWYMRSGEIIGLLIMICHKTEINAQVIDVKKNKNFTPFILTSLSCNTAPFINYMPQMNNLSYIIH